MRTLKTAVVGLGFVGISHLQGHQACPQTKLAAVVDVNRELGLRVASEYGVTYYSDLDEMLRHEAVDMIDICLPTFLHEQTILRCAQAGKHILCEKPITFTMESYARITMAVERADVRFMVAQVIRFWPEYVRVKQALDEGSFGKLQMVSARRYSEAPVWSGWYQDPEKSGGGLYDLMLHDLDFVQWALGAVRTVFATGCRSETGCWNHVQANIVFQSGVSAMVEGCNSAYGGYPFTMDLQIFGERLLAAYRLQAGHNLDSIGSRDLHFYRHAQVPECQKIALDDGYQAEIAYFANCILQDTACERVTIESSRRTLALVLAVKQSLETGRAVDM